MVNKKELQNIYEILDAQRIFTIYSPNIIYKAILKAKNILENEGIQNDLLNEINKALEIGEEYFKKSLVNDSKEQINQYCIKMIRPTQYPIKQFVDTI
ncbi:hypothetical protein [Gaetbulibacter sp. PBL-D1]|uniref:hypothetical protein n=1 Tax=Gaetbulibacter sp. PBL-D1 TaxID=3422594 RepID=UPI003D2EDAE1